MSSENPQAVTQILMRWRDGDTDALEELVPFVYEELRKLAHLHLNRERKDHTLNTTALVHEAYLNLVDQEHLSLQNRAHFFAIASRVMRRVLIWYARKRSTVKRGGEFQRVTLDSNISLPDTQLEELIELDRAMKRLEDLDERLCRVVECRYYAGLSVEETADVLAVSPSTVKRDWQTARAWLKRELDEQSY